MPNAERSTHSARGAVTLRRAVVLHLTAGLVGLVTPGTLMTTWWFWLAPGLACVLLHRAWRGAGPDAFAAALESRRAWSLPVLLFALSVLLGFMTVHNSFQWAWVGCGWGLLAAVAVGSLGARSVPWSARLAGAGVAALLAVVTAEAYVRLRPGAWDLGAKTPPQLQDPVLYEGLTPLERDAFRTAHEPGAPPAGVFRVVALGDSVTWGYGIARTADCWTARLEERLGPQVQVVNLGVVGAHTVSERTILREFGWDYEPDLVILQFTRNDAMPTTVHGWERYPHGLFEEPPRLLPEDLHDALFVHSALYGVLDAGLRPLRPTAAYPDGANSLYHDGEPGWTRCRRALARLADDCAGRKIPLAAFYFDPDWTPEGALIPERIAAEFEANGTPFWDGRAALAADGRPPRSYWARAWDSHPNERAHELVAAGLAEKLREWELLPDD